MTPMENPVESLAGDRRTDPSRSGAPSTIAAALGGLIAGAFGLAAAEIPGALSSRFRSPVFDVGDRVIDAVPAWLKDLAIDLFGTNDKIVLLATIGALVALYAGVLGVVAIRHRRVALGLVGVVLFGVVGAAAALASRSGASVGAVVPSAIGALGAGGALFTLTRRSAPADTTAPHAVAGGGELDRRRFTTSVAAVGASTLVIGAGARRVAQRFSVDTTSVAARLAPTAGRLDPVPTNVSAPIDGVSPFFTPNKDFYRIDTALTVPQIRPEDWSLTIKGRVDQELTLTYDDLLGREQFEADITLTCVSNEIGGSLLGTARWLGVRLDDLLAEAGIDPSADQIVGRSIDGFTGGFPVAALDGRDAMVAIAMNGEPLPVEHGFPARLVIPGIYGYVSATKWLTEIELTRFDEFDGYWVPRGWSALGPIKTQSRIDTPRGLDRVAPGPIAVGGVAWAQTVGIDAVELQIDDGEWLPTTLAEELNDVTWRQWHHIWDATPGRHTLRIRATDRNGETQTGDRSEPAPNGATGQHQIVVLVDEQG